MIEVDTLKSDTGDLPNRLNSATVALHHRLADAEPLTFSFSVSYSRTSSAIISAVFSDSVGHLSMVSLSKLYLV